MEETRVAVIGIMIEETTQVPRVNDLLHTFGPHIIGRMGLPHPQKKLAVISIIMDAPQDVINTLSGKLGMIAGVSAKTIYSKG